MRNLSGFTVAVFMQRNVRPQMQNYRGYSIHLARMSSAWRCFVSPTTNDLPILARYCFKHPTKAAALDHAKLRVDNLLAHERLSNAGTDSQEPKGEAQT